MRSKSRIVMKFGGSVFRDAEGFRSAAKYMIKSAHEKKPIAVVSAPKGVTDLLTTLYLKHDQRIVSNLKDRYKKILSSISDDKVRLHATKSIDRELRDLKKKMSYDQFVSKGENHSGILLAHVLRSLGQESEYVDGYSGGIVASSKGVVRENLSVLNVGNNLGKYLGPNNHIVPVVGGFVGKELETGRYKLLGRNSTDVTGAIVAAAIGADYEIVKDVPGIYFVEPEFGKSDTIPYLNYDEAGELTWRGVEVVHPVAIRIVASHNIPIRIKNLTEKESTLISDKSITTRERPIAGISARRFYFLTVSDEQMSTEEGRGYLSNTTGALSNCGVDVYDVATSANVISMTIQQSDSVVKGEKIESIMKRALEEYGYKPTIQGRRIGAISVVGKALRDNTKIISSLMSLFFKRGINILMISKSNGQNIILGVDESNLVRSIRAIHSELHG